MFDHQNTIVWNDNCAGAFIGCNILVNILVNQQITKVVTLQNDRMSMSMTLFLQFELQLIIV